MKIFLLLCLFCIPALAQEVTYDKFKDTTYVSTNIGISKIGVRVLSTVTMKVGFSYSGQTFQAPEKYDVFFTTRIPRDWLWLNNRKLIFLVDNERIEIGEGSRSSKISQPTYETLGFRVSGNVLHKIANASKVQMQIGTFEGYMGEKDQRKLKEILEYK
jgi:hypothetical protein